ncbi:hypothetical protein HGB13_00595 [bacterium]|nr:hypothetical protein [bacterium]
MAIAYQESASLGTDNTGLTWTVSYTVATGTNRILFVGASDVVAASSDITGITYGGVSMTKVAQGRAGSDRYSTLWMLVNPASGANNIVFSRTTSGSYIEAVAISYSGANQTSQPDGTAVNQDTSDPNDNTITTTADNCWHLMLVHRASAGTLTAGSNTTIRANNSNNTTFFDGNGAITPAGSNTITCSGVATTVSLGVTFSPAVTSNPGAFFQMF